MLSVLIDVLAGLALVYLLLAVFVSGLNEWIAAVSGRRGKFLRKGLVRLIPDQAIYRRLIHHPLIEGLYRDRIIKGHLPAYIEPANFANAIVDVICLRAAREAGVSQPPGPRTFEEVYTALCTLKDHGYLLPRSLIPLLDRAPRDYTRALREIEDWFNASMDRVLGWYKQHTKKQLFFVALLVAVLANIDSVALFQSLEKSAQLRTYVLDEARRFVGAQPEGSAAVPEPLTRTPADEETRRVRDQLVSLHSAGLPIGFACLSQIDVTTVGATLSQCAQGMRQLTSANWLLKLIGWLLTALAVTLGAPLWFELLSKMINPRVTGARPKTGSEGK